MKTNSKIQSFLMPVVFAAVLLFTGVNTSAQKKNWGIGFRFGDPAGVSLKHNNQSGNAWEFSIGRSYLWGYDYRTAFYNVNGYTVVYYDYLNYRLDRALALKLDYLITRPIGGANGLDFYFGPGIQFRFSKVFYDYRYKYYYGPDNNDWHWAYATDFKTYTMGGIDGIIGLEYNFPDAPFAVFLDGGIFIEILDNPFWADGQAGIGARFNF